MVETESFDPATAIFSLDADRVTVDVGKYIVGILKDEWESKNTDGMKPNVQFAELTKNIDFSGRDWIIMYTVSENSTPVTITYQFENSTTVLSLDFYTSKDRKHLIRVIEEARRVVQNHRTDTFGAVGTTGLTGRQWLKWDIHSTPFERTSKLFYRKTVDIEIRWVFRSIEG